MGNCTETDVVALVVYTYIYMIFMIFMFCDHIVFTYIVFKRFKLKKKLK